MSAVPKKIAIPSNLPQHVADPISLTFMHADLARSGLVPADMGCYPTNATFSGQGQYVIPYQDGVMYRVRIDRNIDKYMQPKGQRGIWTPCVPSEDHSILYLVEGEKKAAKFLKRWPKAIVIGIGGCEMALERYGDGSRRLLPAIAEFVRPRMQVVCIFDGDIETKPGVQRAAHATAHAVEACSASVEVFRPPSGKGVDDWLVEDPSASLEELTPVLLGDLQEGYRNLQLKLGCQMHDSKLVLNEINARKLLFHNFGEGLFRDKRLGLIRDGYTADANQLRIDAIEYLQGEINYHYAVGKIQGGLSLITQASKDFVQELVRKIEWDGVPRLDTWGSRYFSTEFPAYADEWGRQLMTGMALRILKPGTKVDRACILIGDQGIGKSTFFEELATFDGHSFYHACTDLGSSGDRGQTQGQLFAASVVVDLAEGVIFESKKSVMDRSKQLITQRYDEFRVAFATETSREDRGFIFVGTTNRRDQLGDDTGSRRFLNLEVKKITKLPYLEKLQILAEVVYREHEISNSNWYDLRVKLDEAPEELRAANPHITNVQELVNAKFQRDNPTADFLVKLLDSGEVACAHKSPHDKFITSGYVEARFMRTGRRPTMSIPRALSALSSSPHFAYELTPWKALASSLLFAIKDGAGKDTDLSPDYLDGINNKQQMMTGYRCIRRLPLASPQDEQPVQEVTQE
jgi:hypothetical protein